MCRVRSLLPASMPARRSGCTADRPCSEILSDSLACGRASAQRDDWERRTCACDQDFDGGSNSKQDNSSHGSGEVAESVRRRKKSMQVSLSWVAAVTLAIIAFAETADCGHSVRGAPQMQRHATPQPRGAASPQMHPLMLRLRGGGGDNQARTMPPPTHLREQNHASRTKRNSGSVALKAAVCGSAEVLQAFGAGSWRGERSGHQEGAMTRVLLGGGSNRACRGRVENLVHITS